MQRREFVQLGLIILAAAAIPNGSPVMVWSNQAPTSITFPPGAGPGTARLVIDANGIRAYDVAGDITFDIDVSIPQTQVSATQFVAKIIYFENVNGVITGTIDGSYNTAGTDLHINPGATGKVNIQDPFSFGSGYVGGYYSEEVHPNVSQVVPTGAITKLTNLGQNSIRSDYPNSWDYVNGIWTSPVDSDYNITMCIVLSVAGAFGRIARIVDKNTLQIYGNLDYTNFASSADPQSVHINKFLAAGTQLIFDIFQNSGGNVSLPNTGYIHIKRDW